jgi:hypothetical protein
MLKDWDYSTFSLLRGSPKFLKRSCSFISSDFVYVIISRMRATCTMSLILHPVSFGGERILWIYIEPSHSVEHTERMHAQTRNTYVILYDYIIIIIIIIIILIIVIINCKWVFTRWQWYNNKTADK